MDEDHLYKSFVVVMITLVIVLAIAAGLAFYGKYAEALGISGVMTTLLAIATLLARGKSAGSTQGDNNLATALDKIPPATTGTGSAEPLKTDVEPKKETQDVSTG